MSYEPPSYGSPPPPPGGGGYGAPPPGGGYGAPPPGFGGQPASNSVLAIVSLVTGILGVLCCGCLLFGIAGAVTGYLAKKEIAESGGAKTGAGMAQAGFILGLVGIGLGIAYWIASIALNVSVY